MNLWLDTWRLWKEHPRERVKLLLGQIFYPRATHQWLSYVRDDEMLWQEAVRFPQLVTRIYRPYALRHLSCRERVAHMIQHHELLRRQGLRPLLAQSTSQPLTLLHLPTKAEGDCALVRLLSIYEGHREGEKHLQFLWNGECLYTLSFLLRERHGRLQLLVTRLQGSGHLTTRDAIRQATKSLHGCRPTVMLVQLVRQFALTAGCQEVLLVSHRMRVALNLVRRLRIKADLESLWQELGAAPHPEGFFALSSEVEIPHDFSSVASNKRAEARRRADVLRQCLQMLDQSLQAQCASQPSPMGAGARETMMLNNFSYSA